MKMPMENAASVSLLLEELAAIGADKEGGVSRLLYTREWSSAQAYLAERMAAAGLETRFDRVGNLYGRLRGSLDDQRVILTGSHIDTVRSGGKYDGAYGIAAALTAVAFLKNTYGPPKRSLEVVSFCEEEGSRFPLAYWGSGNVAGFHNSAIAELVADKDGVWLKEAMEQAGYGGEELPHPLRSDLAAYIEAHIEQGVLLERTGDQAGIVETIAGQRRYIATVTGETNHAGTTPMSMRRDAAAAAAEMLLMVEQIAVKAGEPLVATVGQMKVWPNISNVIAGSAQFTLDIRHMSETLLSEIDEEVQAAIHAIACRRGVEIDIASVLQSKSAPMDAALIGRLERICGTFGISYRRMMSGAGHDAQMFSGICPTAMLFVPSKNGISHSPEEYTEPADLARGVRVLAEMLYELGYEDEEACE